MAEALTIGLIMNPLKAGGKALLRDLILQFEERNVSIFLEEESARQIDAEGGLSLHLLAEKVDILVILGGDGTILYNLRRLGDKVKPVAAINTGTLGFLTCATADESQKLVDCLISGDYKMTKRTVISCDLTHHDEKRKSFSALNEVTIGRGMNSRVVHVEACVNGLSANRYTGDGLIIATPTGSTAYSLSAGGPLVEPEANVFIVTPICPHTVANRPLIIGGSSEISLHIPDQRDDLSMTIDGKLVAEISREATVDIKMADFHLPLVSLPGQNFFGVLNQKLGWTGTSIG